MDDIQGLLLVDKPAGWTSFDVVAKVRGVLSREIGKRVKVGHTGTLDPAATGLLVLAIGKSTKRITTLTKVDKTYEATIMLGATSSTDDAEGEIAQQNNAQPDEATVRRVLKQYTGKIEQIPPAFSAIKIDGKRAYKLAREGQAVKIDSRTVTIHEITDVQYEYPTISCTITVSSGTYIRSLARDIGQALGAGAYLISLRRTRVGDFSIEQALEMDAITPETIKSRII